MSEGGWASLIAILGWLILAIGAFRAHRLGVRRVLAMGLTWGAIFLLVMAIIAAVSA